MKLNDTLKNCEIHKIIFQRIYPLLSRSFQLISNVEDNRLMEVLYIIKNDVDEINKIFNETSEIFQETFITPKQLKQNPNNCAVLINSSVNIQFKNEISESEAFLEKIKKEPIHEKCEVEENSDLFSIKVEVDDMYENCDQSEKKYLISPELTSVSHKKNSKSSKSKKVIKRDTENSECIQIDSGKNMSISQKKLIEKPEVIEASLKQDSENIEKNGFKDSSNIFCKFCNKQVKEKIPSDAKQTEISHMIKVHPNKVFSCDCGFYALDELDMTRHCENQPTCKSKKLIERVSCHRCGLQFLDEKGNLTDETQYFWVKLKDERFVENHLKSCESERIIKTMKPCKMCLKEYETRFVMRHYIENHKKAVVKCTYCGILFTQFQLKSHQYRHHKRTKRSSVCQHCGKFCSSQNILRDHTCIKINVKKVTCEICNKQVINRNIKFHRKLHEYKGLRFACDFCGKKYSFVGVKNHMKYCETGIVPKKPIIKQQCPICFIMVCNTKTHIRRTHEDREAHTCKTCGRKFYEERYLHRHEIIHTKEYTWICPYKCGKGYNAKFSLDYHVDTIHTKVKRYVCKVPNCGADFWVNLYLRKHMKKIHPDLLLNNSLE